MNEHYAREVFAHCGVIVSDDNSLSCCKVDDIYRLIWNRKYKFVSGYILMEGKFSSELLVALAWWMQNK